VRRRLILALAGAVLMGGLFVGTASAAPLQTLTIVEPIEWDRTLDSVAIRGILEAHCSPIPWATVAAFKYNHADFDVAGFMAVAWAESSLGKNTDKCNPGSIKGGPVGTLWRDLRVGVSPRGFNVYPDLRAGTRALIYLLMQRGYNEQLSAGDFEAFAQRYYGSGPGLSRYVRNLRAAHDVIVGEARSWGLSW
jgi:hypothetical protein